VPEVTIDPAAFAGRGAGERGQQDREPSGEPARHHRRYVALYALEACVERVGRFAERLR